MSKNLELWQSIEQTDPNHTSKITGKSYQGTSPRPYYLVRKATETFGPCGIGWGFKILEEKLLEGHVIEGDTRHIIHMAKVLVWYSWQGKRGEVEHVGETVFCGKNKNGLFTDEDAPKKSVTDALVKALSMIGFAGDIFMGRYDDSKYIDSLRECAHKEEDVKSIDSSAEYINSYVDRALRTIAAFESAPDLKAWWGSKREADSRAALDIVNGKKEYITLFNAFVARGTALSKARGVVA